LFGVLFLQKSFVVPPGEALMVESALALVAKILFLFVFTGAILLSVFLIGVIAVWVIAGCTSELYRIMGKKLARSRR
jgi:fatty acid desaturase